jgi:hypothetical protein
MAFSLLLNQSGVPPMNKNSLNFVVIGVGLLLSGTLCGSALADTEESGGPESRETLLRPERLVSISGVCSEQLNGRTGYVYLVDLEPGLHWIQVHP